MKRKALFVIIIAIISMPVIFAFADGDKIMAVSGDVVEAGKQLDFKLNLEAVDVEEYGPYSLRLSVTPADSKVSIDVKDNVPVTVNKVSGTYTMSSADLENLKTLSGTINADSTVEEKTSYNLTLEISGQLKSQSEDFAFTVVPPAKPGTGGFSGGGGGDVDPKTVYKGSQNNYLKSLSISGHTLTSEFCKTRDTYFVNVDKEISKLNVSAIPCDKSAKVDIVGNSNVSEDMSKISIVVTAYSGDTRTYKIYVKH